MTEPARAHLPIEVRYAETDQMGVVHHANYLVWFEQARTRLCADSGYHYAEIERNGHLILVTGARLSYRGGARYGDTVDVVCWLERLFSRGLRFRYEVWRGEELLVDGSTEHVWVDAATGRPRAIPSPYKEAFAALQPPSSHPEHVPGRERPSPAGGGRGNRVLDGGEGEGGDPME